MAQVDSSRLEWISIRYLNRPVLVNFQVPELFGFVDRSEDPHLAQFRRVDVTFESYVVSFGAYHETDSRSSPITTDILCLRIDWQVLHIVHVLSQLSASDVDRLHICCHYTLVGIDDTEWLKLLRPFTTVQALHVSEMLAEHLCSCTRKRHYRNGDVASFCFAFLRGPAVVSR